MFKNLVHSLRKVEQPPDSFGFYPCDKSSDHGYGGSSRCVVVDLPCPGHLPPFGCASQADSTVVKLWLRCTYTQPAQDSLPVKHERTAVPVAHPKNEIVMGVKSK